MRGVSQHIRYSGGAKTVCVSSCLAALGVPPKAYTYTSSKRNRYAYENVLRRFGYSVRSRASEFKVIKADRYHRKLANLSDVRRRLKASDYTSSDRFLLCLEQTTCAHLILLDGNGNTIRDTAPNKRWKVSRITLVQ
jgi:hypothetical protein